MRTKWIWPAWAGGIGGVVAAVALSFLLRQGTGTLTRGLQLAETGTIRTAISLLLLGGLVAGAVTILPRLHPLLPGIPAAWFVVVYVPALFSGGPAGWHPTWMTNHFLMTASAGPFLLTGVLVVATITSLFRLDLRLQTDEEHDESVAGG